MRRGFKADAERRAIAARAALALDPVAPLCPWTFAQSIGAMVLAAGELDLEAQHAFQLLQRDPDSWSGMTLFEANTHVIVLNSAHARTRQAATLMHEVAHIELAHVPAEVSVSSTGLVLLSDYSADQEQEADWLGAAMLLPEPALLQERTRGSSVATIASAYGVSEQLCHWRCRMTGVEKRLAFRGRV